MWDIKDEPLEVTAEEFLSALFLPDEVIRTRFYLDDKNRKDKGRKKIFKLSEYAENEYWLKYYNDEEQRSVCFVVNGGGDTDKEVKAAGICRAQFMEHDEVSIDEQLAIINGFPLEPSAVIRSRHSLHCYWFMTADADIARFRKIQLMFCDRYGCDRKIQNESRVMRLPGFYNRKECFTENREEPYPVHVIHWAPELQYSQDELINALEQVPVKGEPASDPEPRKARKTSRRKVAGILDQIEEGNRTEALISHIGRLKHTYLSDDEIRNVIISINESKCVPPLTREELENEVFPAIARFPSEPPKGRYNRKLYKWIEETEPERRFKWSDLGNGELFAEAFRSSLRWNVTAKEWYFYDGRVWSEDTGGLIAAAAAGELQKCLLIYSTTIQDADLRAGYQEHILSLASLHTRKRMLEDARSHYFVRQKDFDADPMLINLQNGVLDLRSFTLLPHDPELMLSKICNVDYDPEAAAPRWRLFIREVMQSDEEKAIFLQKAAGLALTGDTREETCFLLYGRSTRNGKGTFVETISHVLGDYALAMRPDTLAKKKEDSRTASPDIARLKGCRFLNASEPERSMIFDTALLKTLLGRDTITARFLFENEFQFLPEFKLFINTNYLPAVKDDTLFASGRVHVITFNRHFSEAEQDKDLKNKLRSDGEKSGVLNWLLDGLKRYRSEGLTAPASVLSATEEYRQDSDKIGLFLAEYMEPDKDACSSAAFFYERYSLWSSENGWSAENKSDFFEALRIRGIMSNTGTVGGVTKRNVVKGYRLKFFAL